jgi:hypothetical protein
MKKRSLRFMLAPIRRRAAKRANVAQEFSMSANAPQRSMPNAQSLEDFLNPAFVRKAKRELEKSGFISDEHNFAPYGEALPEYCKQIERELRRIGFNGHLTPGFVKNHPTAGYAHYLYDTSRFRGKREAEAAVRQWLDRKYPEETQA